MRDRKQRKHGQDQPWREERRQRYPDEPYSGEREWQSSADDRQSDRGRGWEANQDWRNQSNRGAGYRREFSGPEGYGEHDFDRDRMMDWNDSRWNRGASFGFGAEEDSERAGNYADSENYTGRGPKDYRRSDDRIREEVCDVFTDDWRLDASDISVKVEATEVTLTGTVSTRDQKRRAEELAERIRGVGDVHNQIRVLRGETTTGTTPPMTQSRGTRGGASQQQQGIAHDKDRER